MVRSPSNTAVELEVWDSLVVELLLTISAFHHPFNWDTLEVGRGALQRIRHGMSPELKQLVGEIEFTGHRADAWGSLAAWTWQQRLREPAAAADAIESAPDGAGLIWPSPTRRRLAEVIRLWRRDLFAAQEEQLRETLAAEAQAKRDLAARLSLEKLIETATNGIVWHARPEVRRVVLIPNQVMSPWSTHEHLGDAVLFTFPVAGPADPMQRVQRLAGVLSDRSRLAALRLLAGRQMTLQELADELGVRKSTMHHHLSLLRAAGLLRVPFGTKAYSLRREPLRELGVALNEFGREK